MRALRGTFAVGTLGLLLVGWLNADGTLAASTGCRDVTGHYTISGNGVEVTLDHYDMIACAGERGDQDVHVLGVISNGFSVTIDGQSMTLTGGNKGLAYRAGP